MKTDELVTMLATGSAAARPKAPGHRFVLALGYGGLAAALLMAFMLGVRPDLVQALRLPMFWAKLGFTGSLAAASAVAAIRLSRPGASLAAVPAVLAAIVLAMWALAALSLARAAPGQWPELVFGQTWRVCPFLIAVLSVPVFVAVLWAMQGLAPTRLRLAGATAGLLAGTSAALVYCVHCPELTAPFIGLWYVLGMLIPAGAGALLGPRLLRW